MAPHGGGQLLCQPKVQQHQLQPLAALRVAAAAATATLQPLGSAVGAAAASGTDQNVTCTGGMARFVWRAEPGSWQQERSSGGIGARQGTGRQRRARGRGQPRVKAMPPWVHAGHSRRRPPGCRSVCTKLSCSSIFRYVSTPRATICRHGRGTGVRRVRATTTKVGLGCQRSAWAAGCASGTPGHPRVEAAAVSSGSAPRERMGSHPAQGGGGELRASAAVCASVAAGPARKSGGRRCGAPVCFEGAVPG